MRIFPPVPLALGVVAMHVVGNGVLIVAWRDVVALAGPHLRFVTAARSWSVSQIARFTTPAAQVGARMALARRHGVPLATGAVSTLVEITWMFAFDPMLALLTLPAWAADVPELRWLSLVSLAPAFVIVATVVAPDRTLALVRRMLLLPGVRRVGARVADKAGDLHVPRRSSLRLLALYAVNTGIRLGAFLLVVAGLTGGTGVGARAIGAYALGQIVGRLAVFAPGGVGPREGVTALVLTAGIGAAPALAAVTVTRILEFAAEVLVLGGSLAAYGRTRPEADASA